MSKLVSRILISCFLVSTYLQMEMLSSLASGLLSGDNQQLSQPLTNDQNTNQVKTEESYLANENTIDIKKMELIIQEKNTKENLIREIDNIIESLKTKLSSLEDTSNNYLNQMERILITRQATSGVKVSTQI